MKKKVLIGVLSTCLFLGGAIAFGAEKSDLTGDHLSSLNEDRPSIKKQETHSHSQSNSLSLETEVEHDKIIHKIKSDDESFQNSDSSIITKEKASDITQNYIGGEVTKIEIEEEHGNMQYKVEIQNGDGETEVRIDATTGDIFGSKKR